MNTMQGFMEKAIAIYAPTTFRSGIKSDIYKKIK